MIKLFWNTHNQKKPSSDNKKIREKQEVDKYWGSYHKKSSDKWIYEILKEIKYETIENEEMLQEGDVLIIIDSSVEEKVKIYENTPVISLKEEMLRWKSKKNILVGQEFRQHYIVI